MKKKTSDKIADDACDCMFPCLEFKKKMCHTCIQNYLDALKFACDVKKIDLKSYIDCVNRILNEYIFFQNIHMEFFKNLYLFWSTELFKKIGIVAMRRKL